MKLFKYFLIVTFITVILVGVWKESFDSDGMKIHDIAILGASSSTSGRLHHSLEPLVGVPLWQIPVDNTVNVIKKDPWVESVSVHRQFPHTLSVMVTERKPFAVMGNGSGQFSYVDESNTVIDHARSLDVGRYPVLMGSAFEKDSDLRAEALALLKSLPPDGVISQKDISDLRFDDEHGFQLMLSNSGLVIDIGKENLPLHLDRSRRVVQYLNDHKINASRLDSDYAKKVLVKVRKGQ